MLTVMVESSDLRRRADNLYQLGRLDEARAAAGEALAGDPDDALAIRLLAQIEMAAGNETEAIAHAEVAVGLRPDGVTWLVLASMQRRTGDFAAAIGSAERGLEVAPDLAALHVTRSLAWSGPWIDDRSASTRRDAAVAQAREAAERARELDPQDRFAWFALASAHLADGDPFAAATAMEEGLRLSPDWFDGHVLMSAIRSRQGMVKLASRHLATAGRLDPRRDEPIRRLRLLRGPRPRWWRRGRTAWWLDSEARDVLARDDELGGERNG